MPHYFLPLFLAAIKVAAKMISFLHFEKENYYFVFNEIHENSYIVASSSMLAHKPCEFICKGQSWNLTGTFLLPQIRFNFHCTLKDLKKKISWGVWMQFEVVISNIMILWFPRKRLSTKIYNLIHDKIHGFDCHYHVTNTHIICVVIPK